MGKEKEIPNRTESKKFIESSKSISIIYLNVNDLNLALKRCGLIDWIKKLEQIIYSARNTLKQKRINIYIHTHPPYQRMENKLPRKLIL